MSILNELPKIMFVMNNPRESGSRHDNICVNRYGSLRH